MATFCGAIFSKGYLLSCLVDQNPELARGFKGTFVKRVCIRDLPTNPPHQPHVNEALDNPAHGRPGHASKKRQFRNTRRGEPFVFEHNNSHADYCFIVGELARLNSYSIYQPQAVQQKPGHDVSGVTNFSVHAVHSKASARRRHKVAFRLNPRWPCHRPNSGRPNMCQNRCL